MSFSLTTQSSEYKNDTQIATDIYDRFFLLSKDRENKSGGLFSVFSSLVNRKLLFERIITIATVFRKWHKAFQDCERILAQFLNENCKSNIESKLAKVVNKSGKVVTPSKIPSKTVIELGMALYNKTKWAFTKWDECPLKEYIHLYMSFFWSMDANDNPTIDLRIKWTESVFCNIPVTAINVITWLDMIIGYLNQIKKSKLIINPWHKYWLQDLFMTHLYIQILEYFLKHLSHISIDKLGLDRH